MKDTKQGSIWTKLERRSSPVELQPELAGADTQAADIESEPVLRKQILRVFAETLSPY